MQKELPVRKKIRLEGYNYSNAGCYFITICVKDRHELLWENVEGNVGAAFSRPPLSETGNAIENEIKIIESVYGCVNVDNYVIMPNHIHMIISISKTSDELMTENGRLKAAPTISRIINQFKRAVSVKLGYSIWQKLFHDHIIRNETDYQHIWKYIDENPQKWAEDRYFI